MNPSSFHPSIRPLASLGFNRSRCAALSVLLAFAVFLSATKAQTIVFSDDMNYASNAAIQAAWAGGDPALGGDPNVTSIYDPAPTPLNAFTPAPATAPVMSIGNGVRYRDLDETVTGDWSLTFEVLDSSYSRGSGVFLLNADGTAGYGVVWDTSSVNLFNGNGFLTIREFSNSTYTDWATFGVGTALSTQYDSTHPVTGYAVTAAPDNNSNNATYDTSTWDDFLEVTLTWESATGTLTLYADGVLLGQVVDTTVTSFDRVYVRGNSTSYFDNIVVSTVPEPSCAVMVGLGLGLVLWPKRRGIFSRQA